MVNSKSKSIRLLLISFLLFSCKDGVILDKYEENEIIGYYDGVPMVNGVKLISPGDHEKYYMNVDISIPEKNSYLAVRLRILRKQPIFNMYHIKVFPSYTSPYVTMHDTSNEYYYIALESESLALYEKQAYIADFFVLKHQGKYWDYLIINSSQDGTILPPTYINCSIDLNTIYNNQEYQNDLTISLYCLNLVTNEETLLVQNPFPEIKLVDDDYLIEEKGTRYY